MTEPFADTHLDLDGLADHLAGETDARAHLTTCGGCTARLAELEAAEVMVIAALHSLADPPLPADVADRISAALRAEAPVVTRSAAATVTPLPVARTPQRRSWLPSVAAAAVLVAGGLVGYGVLANGGSDDAATTSAPAAGADGRAEAASYPTVASGLDYADPAAVAGALSGVLDGSAGGISSAQQVPDAAAQDAPAASLGTSDPAASQAQPVVSDPPVTLAAPDPLARLREPAGLADCLATLLDPARPDDRPLALDYASYAGAPALAVVLPDADPSKVAVFVVGPACSRADDDLAFFTRLARP